MRKNKKYNANLDVYAYFDITGVNQDKLINELAKNGISIYQIRKFSVKKMRLAVKLNEIQKFFAITNNLCYNIKRVRFFGKTYPLYRLIQHFGVLFGALFLVISSYFLSGIIYSVEYVGTGAVLKREVQNFLDAKGVKKYSSFRDFDLEVLSDQILATSNKLSFARLKKDGNRLIVELVLAQTNDKESLGKDTAVYSSADGIIEDVKVYRGTALKKAGDKVTENELIVGGYTVIKEKTIEVNPIAYVSIICTASETYVSEHDNAENLATSFALGMHADKDIVSVSVEKTFHNELFVYIVNVNYRIQIYK